MLFYNTFMSEVVCDSLATKCLGRYLSFGLIIVRDLILIIYLIVISIYQFTQYDPNG